jgi:hypothetical protein
VELDNERNRREVEDERWPPYHMTGRTIGDPIQNPDLQLIQQCLHFLKFDFSRLGERADVLGVQPGHR